MSGSLLQIRGRNPSPEEFIRLRAEGLTIEAIAERWHYASHQSIYYWLRRVLASLLWEAATTGKVRFEPEGEPQSLPPKEWVAVAKFIYEQIDGPPSAAVAVDMTTQGQPLGITMVEVIKTAKRDPQE